ncbi:MAG: hypothetical protein ACE5ID_09255 [Acidobacteriota bacterium]
MAKKTWAITLTLFVLGLSSCAKPPEKEISQAEKAVESAREASEDSTYAATELRRAEASLAESQREIQTQKERFAIMRSFDHSLELLARVVSEAETARQTALEQKQAAREAAAERLEQAKEALEKARTDLEAAPRGKGTKPDLQALSADLAGIQSQLQEMEEQIEMEKFYQARDKGDSIIAAARDVSQEIQTAQEMRAKILAARRQH